MVLLLVVLALAGQVELAHDTGSMEGKASRAGTGHVVAFEAPAGGRRWVDRVRIHGARYGGGYDPATTAFRVTLCDERLRALTSFEQAYDRFAQGRFDWVELEVPEPFVCPRDLRVVVEFEPTATKGVYVGWSRVKESHSFLGSPGDTATPIEPDRDWMIRVVLVDREPKRAPKEIPKPDTAAYRKDFDFLARTVRSEFPALRRKGVDWSTVCREWRKRFLDAQDDREHLANVHQLLATLDDMHTGVVDARVEVHNPALDGLYGAGLWIASEDGGRRLVLRALIEGHVLADRLRPGALLLTVAGRPARVVLRDLRVKLRQWSGWSSDHFLDARLSFQFFPFGDAQTIPATFLNPDGEVVEVQLERWGPGGRGLSRIAATMPAGLPADRPAVATRLDDRIGYVRICGGMNAETVEAFHTACDTLAGVDAVLLDCRGMGGGGDGPAWEMAGRFFGERTPQGSAPALEPTGAWQFTGPVVMLTDERMVSSAETFTWAMKETGRAVTVGRPTGGATIIPRTFDAPSGLFRFRLGVHDRKTPIDGVQPEGVGSAPDLYVPYAAPLLRRDDDPVRAAGLHLLRLLGDGMDPAQAVALVGALLDPATRVAPAKALPDDDARALLAERIRWEIAQADAQANPTPDVLGAAIHLAPLVAIAEQCGVAGPAEAARDALERWKPEADAQAAFEELLVDPDPRAVASFRKSHTETRHAAAAAHLTY